MHKITHDRPPHPRESSIPPSRATWRRSSSRQLPANRAIDTKRPAIWRAIFSAFSKTVPSRRAGRRCPNASGDGRGAIGPWPAWRRASLLMLIAIAVTGERGLLRTTQANIEEKKQRKKAEDTSSLAIECARQHLSDNSRRTEQPRLPRGRWSSDTGEKISVPVQPVLSKEAASLLESMLGFLRTAGQTRRRRCPPAAKSRRGEPPRGRYPPAPRPKRGIESRLSASRRHLCETCGIRRR